MPCTSIPDPQSCLRKMLKMNFMIVIMRLGDEIDFWYAGFSNTCEARKIQAPQAQCKHPSRVSFRFAPINPVGLIAQLVARLLDIHSRLPKLLMLVEKTKTLTDFFFWMILGATWWKHFDAKMFSCFAVSQGFLPTSSGSTIFFSFSGLFGAATRQWTITWLTLANRWHRKRWGRAAESFLSLDFNGFEFGWFKTQFFRSHGIFHHQGSLFEKFLPGLWAYYPPICCHLARWTHGGTTRGKRDTLVWVKRLNARL